MTSWVLIAVLAYILFALNGIADKFLLSNVERHPVVYAFYVGIVSPGAFVLAPFGLMMLSGPDMLVAIMAGVCFTIGLYFLYSAINKTTVSRILPIQGGLVPCFTLALAYFLLHEQLGLYQSLSFVFLVAGSVLISLKHDDTGWHPQALKDAIIAAFLFALSFVMTKYIFDQSNFVTGMIWTRVGFFLAAVSFLASPVARRPIFYAPKNVQKKGAALYYAARANGIAAGMLQNYAISLGSVSIVNALQGLQFTFLLVLTSILSIYFPSVLKENITKGVLAQKIMAIVLISAGLYLLTK